MQGRGKLKVAVDVLQQLLHAENFIVLGVTADKIVSDGYVEFLVASDDLPECAMGHEPDVYGLLTQEKTTCRVVLPG